MEENNKAKKFMLFGLIVLVITIAVSSTYAYYVWTTSDNEVTKIVAGVGSATVTFDGGSDINASLRPVSDKSKGIIKNISVKADTTGLVFNMYLDITSIDTGLKDKSFRYEYITSDVLQCGNHPHFDNTGTGNAGQRSDAYIHPHPYSHHTYSFHILHHMYNTYKSHNYLSEWSLPFSFFLSHINYIL